MARRSPAPWALLKLAAELKRLEDEGSSIAFAFSSRGGVVERQVSMLAKTTDLIDEATGFSLRALVIRTFSKPEFDWRPVERAIGLESPARDFRDEVAGAVMFYVLLQLAGRKPYSELRGDWSEAAAHLAAAAAEVDKARAVLARLPGWTDEIAGELLAPEQSRLDAWAWIAEREAGRVPRGRVGRRPMIEFRCLVTDLADAFTRAAGRKPVVFWNASEARYEGALLALVEAVLPGLARICRTVECPLEQPNSPDARGQFIVRTLRKVRTPAH